MQVRNVAGEIVRDLAWTCELHEKAMRINRESVRPYDRHYQLTRAMIVEVNEAVKFRLPHNGDLIDYDKQNELMFYTREEVNLLHLPYKRCLFIFDASVIVTNELNEAKPETAHKETLALLCNETPDGIYGMVFTQDRLDGSRRWSVNNIAFSLKRENMLSMLNDEKGAIQFHVFSIFSNDDPLLHSMNEDSVERRFLNDMVFVLLQFFKVMNCSNITSEVIPGTGAPASVNAKRLSKGKMPLYEYRELTVDTHHDVEHGGHTGHGSGSKKRQHLRRGHIRHYKKSGKRIWIQAHIVGSGAIGRIDKEYNLKHG